MGKLLPFVVLSLLVTGCGQKGPLYLPNEPIAKEQDAR